MPSLESLIPEISAYQQARGRGIAEQGAQLNQMGALQQIMQRQKSMQEEQQIKGVLSRLAQETGGDPSKMGPALIQTGHPKLMELGQRMTPKQAAPQFVNTVDALGNNVQQAVVPTPGMTLPSQPKVSPTPTPTKLEQLTILRDRWRAEGRDVTAVDNAIRKETETAKQISPTVIMPRNPQWEEVDDPLKPGSTIKVNPALYNEEKYKAGDRTGVLGRGKTKEPIERALPGPLQKQLTEASELADATNRFKTTFKDNYAGKTITGDLSNVTGRVFGDDTGQSQWWQDYELHQSQVRNKLFGSALTAPEIEAWNKSAINPRMDPKQVRINLGRRDELEQRAIDRLIRGAAAGRYNREQIEAFTGRSVGVPKAPTPPAPQGGTGNARLKFDAQGNPIP